MCLRILSVHHDRHGLAEVGRISDKTFELDAVLREIPGVNGVIPLSTCNRVEFYVDAPGVPSAQLAVILARHLTPSISWSRFDGDDAIEHLFRVTAGLESMVVGEREIAGQVRRALSESQDLGRSSTTLTMVGEQALRTSRRIARETSFADARRSVVSVGLDLVHGVDWPQVKVLLVGTGSFAGSCVASLRARGTQAIEVHSSSGRATEFAASHGLTAVDDLRSAMAEADLIVTCRGTGTPAITTDLLDSGLRYRFLDLALRPDVPPEIAALPSVTAVDLPTIQRAVSPHWVKDTAHAETLIEDGCREARARLHSRVLDPAVVNLRQAVLELVADEVSRLPEGRPLEREDAAQSLRRLATRLLHVPSMRAKQAAVAGRTQEYLSALAELYGIGDPDEVLDEAECPATGLSVSSLDATDQFDSIEEAR